MNSEHRILINKWIKSATERAPTERNTPLISSEVMMLRFGTIYSHVDLCRELVEVAIQVLVRRFFKEFCTEPEIDSNERDSLFEHYGIDLEDEQILLRKIRVVTVWVPSRDKFCSVYNRDDCSEIELDEAADYLDKMAAEIRQRAQYLRLLATYRRQND